MAKEMMIVFVYDTQQCQGEKDDPSDAVLYFHPGWVSDQQRVALCGQLMGATHFLSSVFARPRIIALQSGKFVIKIFGRYVLAVGTDRNIPDWVLEHRAELLTSLVHFYHCDLQTIADQFPVDQKNSSNNFPDKLYQMFETYLPILQYGGNMFQSVPTVRLPKSGSSVFLEAIQILQCCQQSVGVLGGAILYHNKVVATQLSPDLTKRLVITDPQRIKSPAESVTVEFHLPNGVQILVVYVPNREYYKLRQDSEKARTLFTGQQKPTTVTTQKLNKDPVMTSMKRDKSIIFSTVPEEDVEQDSISKKTSSDHSPDIQKPETVSISSPVLACRPKFNRPTHLPLRFKNVTTRDINESGFCANETDDEDSLPEFTGQTSVCSTPMSELNKVLYGKALSICNNGSGDEVPVKKSSAVELNCNRNVDNSKFTYENALEKLKTATDFFINPYKPKRRASLSELDYGYKKLSNRFTMRAYGIGLSKLNRHMDEEESPTDLTFGKKVYNTITDPCYPVFTNDGLPISRCLFEDYLEQHYRKLNDNSFSESSNDISCAHLEGFDSEMKLHPIAQKSIDVDIVEKLNKDRKDINKDAINKQAKLEESNIEVDLKTPSDRRKLSLPLKSLTTDPVIEDDPRKCSQSECSNLFDSPMRRRNLGGIPLTPLMTKLSILALDEKSSGFCSRDTTPSEMRDFACTPMESGSIRKSFSVMDDISKSMSKNLEFNDEAGVQRVELLVCGQQNVTMLLILEDKAGQSADLIHAMWETSVARLPPLEAHLTDSLGASDTGLGGHGGYSYMCVDPQWDTLQRGGPWGPEEMTALGHMHCDFAQRKNIVEIVLRSNESIMYGYQCGQAEVYYQQTAGSHAGLPTPADLMGTVPLRARRRLERDHAIILL